MLDVVGNNRLNDAKRLSRRGIGEPEKFKGPLCSEPLFVSPTTVGLLTQTESLDQFTIAVDVLVVEVLQKLTTATYHLGQCTCCTEVLVILLQVLGEVLNAESEQGNLALY